METAQDGMVQFVAADFEIHLGAIDRAGAIIIESDDRFFPPLSVQYQARRRHDSRLPSDLLILRLNLRPVQKDDAKRRDLVCLAI